MFYEQKKEFSLLFKKKHVVEKNSIKTLLTLEKYGNQIQGGNTTQLRFSAVDIASTPTNLRKLLFCAQIK